MKRKIFAGFLIIIMVAFFTLTQIYSSEKKQKELKIALQSFRQVDSNSEAFSLLK